MNSYEKRQELIAALSAKLGNNCRVLYDADFGRSTPAVDREGNPVRDEHGNIMVYEDEFDAKYLLPRHTCYVRHTNGKERVRNPMLWVECELEDAEAVYCVGFALGVKNNQRPRYNNHKKEN